MYGAGSCLDIVFYIKGKQQNFVGHTFWARGYFVSTVGADEAVIRSYIQNQEKEDKRLYDLFNR